MKIFGDENSGNCMKVKRTADRLGMAYEWVAIDIMHGESRTPGFLAMSAAGQVPVVAWPDGRVLAQSNAIIRYLAAGTSLLPQDPFEQAKVDEWLFWEQYSHEPYVAVCRFQMLYEGRPAQARDDWRVARGEAALDHLDAALAARRWLVGEAFSIADIALHAYTHVAHEGGFDLGRRPHLTAWVDRCDAALAAG